MSENEPNRCPYCTKKMDKQTEDNDELFNSFIMTCPEHGQIRINLID